MSWRMFFAVLLALLALPARAGLVVAMQEGDGQSLLYMEGKKLRMEKAGADKQVVIFDGDSSRFLQVDPETRTYSEMTRADGQAIAARLREALARLPGEERERTEALLGKATPTRREVRYEPTGTHQTIAGLRCDDYRKLVDGSPEGEGCFIPWSASAATKEDLGGLFLFGRFMDEMLSGIPGATGGVTERLYGELDRAPGFPAFLARLDPSGRRGSEQRLLSLKRVRVAPEQFVVPAGYSPVKMVLPE